MVGGVISSWLEMGTPTVIGAEVPLNQPLRTPFDDGSATLMTRSVSPVKVGMYSKSSSSFVDCFREGLSEVARECLKGNRFGNDL